MRFLESKYPKIEHSFNAEHRERFAGSLPDGYDRGSQKLFYLHGCRVHGMFTEDAEGNPDLVGCCLQRQLQPIKIFTTRLI